jgi:hypothetical protein
MHQINSHKDTHVCVRLCMYVYIYIYMYVCVCVHMCLHASPKYVCVQVHVYICTYIWTYVRMYACVFMYVCMYACMYVCMYVCYTVQQILTYFLLRRWNVFPPIDFGTPNMKMAVKCLDWLQSPRKVNNLTLHTRNTVYAWRHDADLLALINCAASAPAVFILFVYQSGRIFCSSLSTASPHTWSPLALALMYRLYCWYIVMKIFAMLIG